MQTKSTRVSQGIQVNGVGPLPTTCSPGASGPRSSACARTSAGAQAKYHQIADLVRQVSDCKRARGSGR